MSSPVALLRSSTLALLLLAVAHPAQSIECNPSIPCPKPATPTITVDPIDSNGNFIVWVGYGAANYIEVIWRGSDHGTNPAYPFYNPWGFSLNAACLTEPEELTVRVSALMECQGGSQQFNCSDTARVMINPPANQPSVRPRLVDPASDGSRRFAIDYDLAGNTSPMTISATLLPLSGGSATPLGTWTPTGTGTTAPVTVPEPGNVYITWTYCGVIHYDSIPIDGDCDDCASSCPSCVGDPVRVANGNTRFSDIDPLPGIEVVRLKRTYDSTSTAVGYFGRRWTSLFDARARAFTTGSDASGLVDVLDESGRSYLFRRASSTAPYVQIAPAPGTSPSSLQAAAGGWLHRDSDGAILRSFDASGRITRYSDAVAHGITISYAGSPSRPSRVADDWGRSAWLPVYNATGRIERIDVENAPTLSWFYTYAGDHLDSVASPEGPWRDYNGTGTGNDWRITAVVDAHGNAVETDAYDAFGRATDSHGPTAEIDLIEYWLPGRVTGEYKTAIHYKTGRVETHYQRTIAGRMRTVQIQSGCASCGSSNGTYWYEPGHGNLTRFQAANGYITENTYDASHLHRISVRTSLKPSDCDPAADPAQCRLDPDQLASQSVVETTSTVSTTYGYGDANWPLRPTSITVKSLYSTTSTPRTRTESRQYDPTTGEILAFTVQGWTGPASAPLQESHTTTTTLYDGTEGAIFTPGGSVFLSTWVTLPQPAGVRKTTDGPRPASAANDVTKYVYYPLDPTVPARLRGRLASVKNGAGHITRFDDYDNFGTPVSVVDANGVNNTTSTDGLGRARTATVKGVTACDTTYDSLCGTDLTTTLTYWDAGAVKTEQKPGGGGVTAYGYDSRSRLLSVSRGPSPTDLREQRETTYDPATGKVTMERLLARESGAWVEKKRTTSVYDDLAELVQTINADATSSGYTYNAEGQLATVRDENHAAPNTSYSYDPAGRLQTVTQTLSTAPGGSITTIYAYDNQRNLRSVTDPNGNVTTYVYDDFGKMLSQQSPVSGTTTYAYDVAGNLVTTTDARGVTTTRTYDALNRMTSASAGSATYDPEDVTYSYDEAADPFGVGRVTKIMGPVYGTLYRHDRRGLVAMTIDTDVVTYGHDATGNRTRIGYPSGQVVSYSYDYANRPVSAANATVTFVTSAAYLPFGPMSSLSYGNGATKTMTYDSRYRMMANQLTASSGTLAQYAYQYDASSNITQLHDQVLPGYNRDFGYDDLNRLVTANSGASLWGSGSYGYDRMGNMTSLHLGGRTVSFTHAGTTPKLQSVATTTTAGTVTEPVSYDSVGNDVSLGNYNARNEVAYATSGASYDYDGRGVRVNATYVPFLSPYYYEPSTASRRSVYSPELNLIAQATWGEGILEGFFDGTEYIWFAGQPVAQTFTSELMATRYTFTDHLGTPTLQTDPAGAIVWRAEYEPYGSIYQYRVGNSDDPQELRFPGQESAHVPGMVGEEPEYNIFRWYRSGWGRYTQTDPLDTQMAGVLNNYRYALSNPVRFIDPTGLETTHSSDRINCLLNPIDCARVYHCAEEARKKSVDKFHYERDGSPQNAYKHCYWNCCMAKIIGPTEAKKFGDAHEDYPGNPRCDQEMDLYNNDQGRRVTGQTTCDAHCSNAPLQKWRKCQPCGFSPWPNGPQWP